MKRTLDPAGTVHDPVADDHPTQTLAHRVTAAAYDYPGGVTPTHRHRRAQLLYAGSGVMRIETDLGSWVVPPMRGVWVPADTDHRVVMLGPVAVRTLYVRPDAAPHLATTCCLVEVRPLLRELILALLEEPLDYDESGRGGRLAELALSEIRFLSTPALHLPMPTESRLHAMCRAFLAHPEANDSLDAWAKRSAMSCRTFARAFHRETGMTFGEWRTQARLVESLGLLGQGESVANVADRLGYRSPSAFTAMFKRALGVEPSRYFAGDARGGATSTGPSP